MQVRCLKCKGRGYCGRSFCSIISKSSSMFKVRDELDKQDLSGTSHATFSGHYCLHNLRFGVLRTLYME